MRFVVVLVLALAAHPASAEDAAPKIDADRLGEFADGLRGLFGELADDVLPLMEGFGNQIKDLSMYEAPEVLPNGDIIIRRKPEPSTDTPVEGDKPVDL